MSRIDGRRVLLTGASGGIGQAIAHALARRGAHLLLNGRREEALRSLSAELGDGRAEVLVADLARAGDVDALVERAGRVDILIANAALPASGRLDTFSAEEVDRALDVNLRAPIHLARVLTPAMAERGEGHVVLISSLSGKVATGGGSIYSATKFGLRGFGFALHDELDGTGVGVSTVFPGFISDAGMWAESGAKLPPGIGTRRPDQVAEGVVRAIERGRPELDVAPLPLRATAWLAGPAPSAVRAIGRRLGSSKVAARMAEGQRSKR